MRMRSWLFVPADQPRKFEKARASGADCVILDLEDSVAAPAKNAARAGLGELIATAEGPRDWSLWVRINPLAGGQAADDLAAAMRPGLDGIMLPKAEGGQDVARLGKILDDMEAGAGMPPGHVRIIALVTETPGAMFALGSYAGAHARLAALTWGAEDLSAEIGATTNRDEAGNWTPPYQLARSLCLYAAAHAGVAAIDTLYADYRDMDGLDRSCQAARRDGFAGKLSIHPGQIAPVNAAFQPSAEELALARRIVDAFRADPNLGAVGIDGRMFDLPHLKRAQRLLAAAGEAVR